jgi:hypothetical protein
MWSGYSEKGTGSQERGPASFALQVPGSVEGRAGEQAVAVQGGLRGGGMRAQVSAPAQVRVVDQGDQTLQQLLKIGQNLVAPALKRIEEEQFVKGMTQAASGQALTEIINEQPWYTRIFGDGPVVDGARAYKTDAAASAWASAQEQAMPMLKQRSPDEVPAFLMQSMEAHMTGDPDTDSLIRAQLLKQVPGLVKRHTKEHYKYQQEQASIAYSQAAGGKMARVQEVMAAGPDAYSEDDRTAAGLELLSLLTPPEGRDLNSWKKDTLAAVSLAAKNGQFHAINVLKDAGLYAHLSSEEQEAILNDVQTAGRYHATIGLKGDWLERATGIELAIKNNMIPVDVGITQVRALNKAYSEATGNPVQLVPEPTLQTWGQSGAQAMLNRDKQQQAELARARQSAATEAAKAQVAQAEVSMRVGAALRGSVGAADGTVQEKEDAFMLALGGRNSDEQRSIAALNFQQHGFVSKRLQNQFVAPLRALTDTPDANFMRAYETWRDVNYVAQPDGSYIERPGMSGVSAAYYDDWHSKMQEFHDLTRGGTALEQNLHPAYVAAFRTPKAERELTKDERKVAQSALRAELKSGRWFTARELDDNAEQTVMRVIAPYLKAMSKYQSAETAAPAALAAARKNGLELYGKYAWTRDGSSQPMDTLAMRHGIAPESVGELLNKVVDTRLATLEKRPAALQMFRSQDQHGHAQFVAYASYEDGTQRILNFSTEDMRRELDIKYAPKPTMGGTIVNQPSAQEQSAFPMPAGIMGRYPN